MKKLLITGIIVLIASVSMNAQDISKNALGLRLGNNDGFGGEISYQARLSTNNRLELDLGWRDGKNYDGFKLAGLYQWVWELDGNFNWYAGVGGGFASFSFDNNDIDGETALFVAGDIGIEYNFDAPILISLDYRPEVGITGNYDGLNSSLALAIRYQF